MRLEDLPDEDDFCRECGARLPVDERYGLRRFCSQKCRNRYHHRRHTPKLPNYGARTCQHCAASFTATSPTQKFCGEACFRAARRRPQRVCPGCGTKFTDAPRGQFYCSRPCYRTHRGHVARYSRSCPQCGSRFKPQSRTHTWCSQACRHAARKEAGQRACASCGAAFKPVRRSRKYCSRACYDRAQRDKRRPRRES